MTGRVWKGTAFGGWKSRTEVPRLVQTVMRGEVSLDPYITHTIKGNSSWIFYFTHVYKELYNEFIGLENVNGAIDALHSGTCLRAVVHISPNPLDQCKLPAIKGDVKFEGGQMKQLTHWSESCQCDMTFSIFLPDRKQRKSPDPPGTYRLENFKNLELPIMF